MNERKGYLRTIQRIIILYWDSNLRIDETKDEFFYTYTCGIHTSQCGLLR